MVCMPLEIQKRHYYEAETSLLKTQSVLTSAFVDFPFRSPNEQVRTDSL